MAPPCFADLGKQSRDLFTKNYYYGHVKLNLKTKAPSGMTFTVNGDSNNESGRVSAHLETKHTAKDYGLTIKEKWDTDNTLLSEVTVEDQVVKGSKVSAEFSFAPQTGKKHGILKAAYKNEHVSLNSDMNADESGPVMNTSGVMHYNGWLMGALAGFDVKNTKLVKTNFGIGYSEENFVVHTNVVDGQEFGGYMYQRVNDKLESGLQLKWSAANNATTFGIACAYSVDDDTSVHAKVNNSSQIGLSLTHVLREGIKLTLSALLDGKSLNQGGHKIGLGIELDA